MQVRIAASVYMDVTTNQLWLVDDEDSNKRIRLYRLMGNVDPLDDISGVDDDYESAGGTEIIDAINAIDVSALTCVGKKLVNSLKSEGNIYGVTDRIYRTHKYIIESVLDVMRADPGNGLTSYEINNRLGTPMDDHSERARTGYVLAYLAEAGYINRFPHGSRNYIYELREGDGSSNTNE